MTLGGQDRRFTAVDPKQGSPTAITLITNHRGVLDAQTTYSGLTDQRLTLGMTGRNRDHEQRRLRLDRQAPEALRLLRGRTNGTSPAMSNVTGGLRHGRFRHLRSATTGRATFAWLLANHTLKLRSSYGTGFRTPAFLDLYGKSAFYVGNPNLEAGKFRGWDAGVDYFLPEGKGTLSATWFRSDYSNLIEYNFKRVPRHDDQRRAAAPRA